MSFDDAGERDLLPPGDQKTLEWITVLAAAGLEYRLSRNAEGWVIRVPVDDAAAADREIATYEEEEREWRRILSVRPEPKRPAEVSWSPWWVAALLVSFYLWLGPYDSASAELRRAALDAGAVVDGEWWRLVTALTVHSGVTHILGNVVCLLWMGSAACATFGGGFTWLLILASGVAGNGLACLTRGPQYVSVGASTACFGALGILAAHRAVQSIRRPAVPRTLRDRLWLPLGAGLALLALMGTGVGSDVGAHLFGFLCGLGACLPASWFGVRRLPGWGQKLLQLFCIAVVMIAWHIVFRVR